MQWISKDVDSILRQLLQTSTICLLFFLPNLPIFSFSVSFAPSIHSPLSWPISSMFSLPVDFFHTCCLHFFSPFEVSMFLIFLPSVFMPSFHSPVGSFTTPCHPTTHAHTRCLLPGSTCYYLCSMNC